MRPLHLKKKGPSRPPGCLGLHDILVFRLHSSADRAGPLFYLTRVVGLHSDKTDSRYWRPNLSKPEHRCLVPVTSPAEPDNRQGGRGPSGHG
jgi:hypothetical protein